MTFTACLFLLEKEKKDALNCGWLEGFGEDISKELPSIVFFSGNVGVDDIRDIRVLQEVEIEFVNIKWKNVINCKY